MTARPRIVVLTGPGKGKTTSALGMILRAVGHGRRVLLARFCKTAFSGELAVLRQFPGVAVLSGDCGMPPPADHPEYPRHAAAAAGLFAEACAAAPGFDMIVLDEICGAAARGLVEEGAVLAFMRGLRPDQIAVLTGRNAGPALTAAADTVSEILCVKHGLHEGIEAQEGVER